MSTEKKGNIGEMGRSASVSSDRPLSALLSQILVAFTIEFDNEFERQIGEAGHAGGRLSLVVWSNLVRFISDEGTSVRDLAAWHKPKCSFVILLVRCRTIRFGI